VVYQNVDAIHKELKKLRGIHTELNNTINTHISTESALNMRLKQSEQRISSLLSELKHLRALQLTADKRCEEMKAQSAATALTLSDAKTHIRELQAQVIQEKDQAAAQQQVLIDSHNKSIEQLKETQSVAKTQWQHRCDDINATVNSYRRKCESLSKELQKFVRAKQKRTDDTKNLKKHNKSLLANVKKLNLRIDRLKEELIRKQKSLENALAALVHSNDHINIEPPTPPRVVRHRRGRSSGHLPFAHSPRIHSNSSPKAKPPEPKPQASNHNHSNNRSSPTKNPQQQLQHKNAVIEKLTASNLHISHRVLELESLLRDASASSQHASPSSTPNAQRRHSKSKSKPKKRSTLSKWRTKLGFGSRKNQRSAPLVSPHTSSNRTDNRNTNNTNNISSAVHSPPVGANAGSSSAAVTVVVASPSRASSQSKHDTMSTNTTNMKVNNSNTTAIIQHNNSTRINNTTNNNGNKNVRNTRAADHNVNHHHEVDSKTEKPSTTTATQQAHSVAVNGTVTLNNTEDNTRTRDTVGDTSAVTNVKEEEDEDARALLTNANVDLP